MLFLVLLSSQYSIFLCAWCPGSVLVGDDGENIVVGCVFCIVVGGVVHAIVGALVHVVVVLT